MLKYPPFRVFEAEHKEGYSRFAGYAGNSGFVQEMKEINVLHGLGTKNGGAGAAAPKVGAPQTATPLPHLRRFAQFKGSTQTDTPLRSAVPAPFCRFCRCLKKSAEAAPIFQKCLQIAYRFQIQKSLLRKT